jgi:acetolactate synthase-1/3 small subunit
MRHTLSVLVENKFGVLARVAGMFSGRGYNIDTLNVGPTSDPKVSRMTIVVRGEDATLDQVTKLLDKLVEVIDVIDFHDGEYVDRELVLIQVRVENAEVRSEVIQLCDIFRARIIDVHPKRLTLEITGEEGKINKFVSLMDPFGIIEITRTGKIALPRS